MEESMAVRLRQVRVRAGGVMPWWLSGDIVQCPVILSRHNSLSYLPLEAGAVSATLPRESLVLRHRAATSAEAITEHTKGN